MKITEIKPSYEEQLITLIKSGASIQHLDEWSQLNEVDWKKLARKAAVVGGVGMAAANPTNANAQFAGAGGVDPALAQWFRTYAMQSKPSRDSMVKRGGDQVMRDVGINPAVKQVIKDKDTPKQAVLQVGARALEKAFEHNGQKWVEADSKTQIPDGAHLVDHPKTGQPVAAWEQDGHVVWKNQ